MSFITPLPTERQTQRTILKMMRTCFRDVFPHHSPNGAHLAGDAGVLLGDGMVRGWPDLICVWKGGVAFLEVKRPKIGRLSIHQEHVHSTLTAMGWPVATVTSQEEAYTFLRQCGAPCSAVLS